MGAASVLLSRLRSVGIEVRRRGDQLVIVPRDRLTDELRAAIRARKAELLASLSDASAGTHDQEMLVIESRVRKMAARWGYSAAELAEALAGSKSEPESWLIWTERDERDFGGCVTPDDFARAYARVRRLA